MFVYKQEALLPPTTPAISDVYDVFDVEQAHAEQEQGRAPKEQGGCKFITVHGKEHKLSLDELFCEQDTTLIYHALIRDVTDVFKQEFTYTYPAKDIFACLNFLKALLNVLKKEQKLSANAIKNMDSATIYEYINKVKLTANHHDSLNQEFLFAYDYETLVYFELLASLQLSSNDSKESFACHYVNDGRIIERLPTNKKINDLLEPIKMVLRDYETFENESNQGIFNAEIEMGGAQTDITPAPSPQSEPQSQQSKLQAWLDDDYTDFM